MFDQGMDMHHLTTTTPNWEMKMYKYNLWKPGEKVSDL